MGLGCEYSVQCTQGTFDTLLIKVILGSVSAFPIFEKPVSKKTAGGRVKRSEILVSEVSV